MKLILILLLLTFGTLAHAQVSQTPGKCKVTSQADQSISTSALALSANSARKCLTIQNKDATNAIYIKYDSSHSGTEGIKLAAGAILEFQNVPVNSIYLKASTGTIVVSVIEGQ